MQGVHAARRIDRAQRRHQGLPQHLAAVDPLPAFAAARAPEQVVLELLQIEHGKQSFERGVGRGASAVIRPRDLC